MATKNSVSEVRAWAKEQGFVLADRGRLPAEVWAAWESRQAQPNKATTKARASQPAPAAVTAGDMAALADDLAITAEDVTALADDLAAALARIDQLEHHLGQLKRELAALKQQPRRRFARSRSVAPSAG